MKKIRKLAIFLSLSLLIPNIAYAITNGQPDGDTHPYVCLVIAEVLTDDVSVPTYPYAPAWRGSGSLIAPNLVLTAGHVTDGAARIRVYFDSDLTSSGYPWAGEDATGIPHTNPDFVIGSGNGIPGYAYRDVGIVVLNTDIDVGGFAELPDPGLVDSLKINTDIDLVGYGVQEMIHGGGPPSWIGELVRYFAPAKMLSNKFSWSDEFMRCTSNPGKDKGGTAFGDSGGPVLLGDTDMVLAVVSYGTNYNCAGVSYNSRIDIPEVLDWINSFLD